MKNKELLLEISYDCNLNCIHCSSIGCEGKIKIKDLDKVINTIKIDSVRISGGEPTLNNDLQDYLEFFKSNGVKIILQTNGTTNTMPDRILNNIDEIWVSLYGNQWIHDFITRGDNYYKTINNLTLYVADGRQITIQSPIFSRIQLVGLVQTMYEKWNVDDYRVKLRLFSLLNHGRCNVALPLSEQQNILKSMLIRYPNTEITCSLDTTKCDYENKFIMKPDGSLFNCASHKHNLKLCKK